MEQSTLSIRLSTDGFSFSVFSPTSEASTSGITPYKVDKTLSLTANLKQAFRDVALLSRTYRRVNVLVASLRFTFMPIEFFDDEQAATLFYHNLPPQGNELVLYNILSKNNLVVLYGIDKSAHNFLLEQFPEARFYSQASPLIEHFTAKSRLGNNRKMYANVSESILTAFVFERGRFVYANSFACTTTPDRIYYLLYIWKTFELEQERDELHLCGKLPAKEELLTELRRYVRQVFIINPTTNLDLEAITSCE